MPRILVVEDEVIIARAFCLTLENLGYSDILSVTTGEKAVELAQQTHPDVVFMDIGLPGKMDGVDAALAISRTENARICFVTAYANREIRARAAQVQPADFIEKPVAAERLRSVLGRGRTG